MPQSPSVRTYMHWVAGIAKIVSCPAWKGEKSSINVLSLINFIRFNRVFSTLRYNVDANVWSEVAPMREKIRSYGLAILSKQIYVIGGRGMSVAERNSVDVYNTEKNQWSSAAPMRTKRAHFGCVVFRNCIYVILGAGGSNSIEKYDQTIDRWSTVSIGYLGTLLLM